MSLLTRNRRHSSSVGASAATAGGRRGAKQSLPGVELILESAADEADEVQPPEAPPLSPYAKKLQAMWTKEPEKKDWYQRVARVTGRVVSARGLESNTRWGVPDPYCVVKGIRSNNHLVDICVTHPTYSCAAPFWDKKYSFDCPQSWGAVELVGLKFLVYDAQKGKATPQGSDVFLGGADFDLSCLARGRSMRHEIDLSGGLVAKKRGQRSGLFKKKRPRMVMEVGAVMETDMKPPSPSFLLQNSLSTFLKVSHVEVQVCKAKNLNMTTTAAFTPNVQCIVRMVSVSGTIKELFRSTVAHNIDPTWDEAVFCKFDSDQQPALLIFDIFDGSDGEPAPAYTCSHLGSAILPLGNIDDMSRKRLKLRLKGRTQLLEGRLDADGKQGHMRLGMMDQPKSRRVLSSFAAQKASRRDSGGSTKLSKGIRASTGGGIMHAMAKMFGAGGSSLDSSLTVEVELDRDKVPTPHAPLLSKPIQIRDEEDVKYVLALPDWKESMFQPPDFGGQGVGHTPVDRAELRGRDRIVFVHGIVHGASGLTNVDSRGGRTDPYCIVEGASSFGERRFIWRSNVVDNTSSPVWDEAFYFSCLAGEFELHRMVFSIFGCDSSIIGDKRQAGRDVENRGEDDFLGRATVDLAYLMTDDCISENLPLLGANVHGKSGDGSGFRLSPVISVEVRVERRVEPIYELNLGDPEYLKPPASYVLSRSMNGCRYEDPSRRDCFSDQPLHAAGKIVELRKYKQLTTLPTCTGVKDAIRRTQRNTWLTLPEKRRQERIDPDDDEPSRTHSEGFAISKALQWFDPPPMSMLSSTSNMTTSIVEDHLADVKEVARLGTPPIRPPSLPVLHTRFGRSGPLSRQLTNSTASLAGTRFLEDVDEPQPQSRLPTAGSVTTRAATPGSPITWGRPPLEVLTVQKHTTAVPGTSLSSSSQPGSPLRREASLGSPFGFFDANSPKPPPSRQRYGLPPRSGGGVRHLHSAAELRGAEPWAGGGGNPFGFDAAEDELLACPTATV